MTMSINSINTFNQQPLTVDFRYEFSQPHHDQMMRNVLRLCETCAMATRQSLLLRKFHKIRLRIKELF
jgi:hypothetical protein